MKNFWLLLLAFLLSISANAISLSRSVPAAGASDVNIEGKVVLIFDVDAAAGSGSCTLNGQAIAPVFASKYVTFAYAGLDYETTYSFVVPAGAIKSKSGDAFAGVTLTFTTKKRPDVTPKAFDFVVDPKAAPVSGKIGRTIASAIDAAPNNSGLRYHVFVKNGVYTETLTIPSTKQNISFIGQHRDSVVIRDVTCPVLTIEGSNLYFENLTVQNTANPDYTQYGIAVYTEGSKNIYKNVRFLGHQDTQRTGGDRHYFLHCDIRGTIDFIYGSGDVFFDSCSIFLEPRNLMMKNSTTWDTCCVIAAGSQDNTNKWGFVFNRCSIDGDRANDNLYSLGRPWHNEAKAVYLNTTMFIKPFDYGWTSMGNPPGLYAEYGSVDGNGMPIDLSKRHARYIYNGDTVTASFQPVLDSLKAATYTMANVVGGADAWKPNRTAQAPAAPVLTASGGKISWAAVPYSMCYLVYRNGALAGFTTSPEYTLVEKGIYTVRSAGEYGNLSSFSSPMTIQDTGMESSLTSKPKVTFTGKKVIISGVKEKIIVSIYTLSGILLQNHSFDGDGSLDWNEPRFCLAHIVSGSFNQVVSLTPSH